MRILQNIDVDFVNLRKKGYVFSAVLLIVSIVSIFTQGFQLGIDFLGGTEFIIETDVPVTVTDMRDALTTGLGSPTEAKTFGNENTVLVRSSQVGGDISEQETEILTIIGEAFPDSNPEVLATDSVGPRFAEDLKRGAVLAVLFSLVVIFLYILVRFEWRFGLGAVAAIAHDVTITLGVFSLARFVAPFSLDIDQSIIAAFLTIVGYSLNDTVVVFDRIREYLSIFKTEKYEKVINKSINSTLSRTVITSLTTLFVVVVLFLAGGEVLRGFAFALIVGILIGTYSSVFVAAPVVVELRTRTSKARRRS